MQSVILVIERDEVLREMITRSLRVGGYLVLATADGMMALEIARSNPLSLVMLDPTLGPHIPFGSVKESGMGRENGAEGIEEFLEVRSVSFSIS